MPAQALAAMALSLSEVLTFDPHKEIFSPLPFVQLRKWRLREAKNLVFVARAGKQQRQVLEEEPASCLISVRKQ